MAPKSVPVPMISRVRLKNFRSIAECDVELGPLTILVGPNSSGKSNFLHALDFVSDSLRNGLESAIRRRGGMNSLLSRWAIDDPNATLEIELALDLPEQRHGTYNLALRRTEAGGHKIEEERCRVRVRLSPPKVEEFVLNDQEIRWTNTRGYDAPVWGKATWGRSLILPHYAGHAYFGPVYQALHGMSCYSLDVSEMRKPGEPDGGDRLAPGGSNVASVLERLADKNERGWSPTGRIEDWLTVITPGLDSVRGVNVAGYQALQFAQRPSKDAAPWTFAAGEMSYGTLRSLGILVALYQRSMRGGSPVTLVGLEEPDSAVHPGAATAILEAMDEASLVTQVLATTHSATMLDHEDLDIDIIRGVARVNGRTIIGPVDAPSRQIVSEALSSAGELLRMGHLAPEEASDAPSDSRVVAPA